MDIQGDVDKNAQFFISLGLEVISPFVLQLESGELKAPLLLKDFGARIGMIIIYDYQTLKPHLQDLSKIKCGEKVCYGYSVLSKPKENFVTDFNSTVEMLEDWGWTGDIDSKPTFLG